MLRKGNCYLLLVCCLITTALAAGKSNSKYSELKIGRVGTWSSCPISSYTSKTVLKAFCRWFCFPSGLTKGAIDDID